MGLMDKLTIDGKLYAVPNAVFGVFLDMEPITNHSTTWYRADWAEQLCIDDICSRYQKKGIEDFGYGNGYVYEKEEFGRFLNSLEEIVQARTHRCANLNSRTKWGRMTATR